MWIGTRETLIGGLDETSSEPSGPGGERCSVNRSYCFHRNVSSLKEPAMDEILAFCDEDPIERVFLEDVARRGLGRFTGLAEGRRLVALCHVGANLVPSGRGCGAFAVLDGASRARLVLGEENAVGDFWAAARDRLPSPREDRPGQPVYVLEEPPEPGDTGLRAATPDDLELLVPACAQAYREELAVDPLESDAESYRWRTRTQIDDGRSWLWAEGGTILFKAEASAWTPSAVQLQQVWVDADVRGRGYAQRGMRDLCRLLLQRVPAVCLFVRADNAPAIRLYERIGMRHTISYRTLVFID
jgi:ribosomal protein S18 acetylase RimI-like enzyme